MENGMLRSFEVIYDRCLSKELCQKLSPRQMLDRLKERYPDRYDLPSENEIRQEITKLMKTSSTSRLEGSCATQAIKHFFAELIASHPNIKPRDGLVLFRAKFGDNGYDDRRVTSRISNMKTALKKTNAL
jgi:hypothetical protein